MSYITNGKKEHTDDRFIYSYICKIIKREGKESPRFQESQRRLKSKEFRPTPQ